MKSKRSIFLWVVVAALVIASISVMDGCRRDEQVCCPGKGGISLAFSSLPPGPLPAVFNVDKVTGIRVYDRIERLGTSLWCLGKQEVPPNSGHWKDAAVMLLFSQLPCRVCLISATVHGHGHEARLLAVQQDGTTQAAVCPGGKQVLTLQSTRDNPFTWAILSGQKAEWFQFRLQ